MGGLGCRDWAGLDSVVRWEVGVTLGQVGNDRHLAVPFPPCRPGTVDGTVHSHHLSAGLGIHSAPGLCHLCDQHECRCLRLSGNTTSETPGRQVSAPWRGHSGVQTSGTCSWGGGRAGVCGADVVGINGQITEGMPFSEFRRATAPLRSCSEGSPGCF